MNPMHKRWLATAAGVIVALLTARLGVWQLDRATEKAAAAESRIQRAGAQPWTARDWPCGGRGQSSDAALPINQPVVLRGRWMREHTVFLDNRPMGGQPGFYVVTPLKLSGAACPGGIVLVQRGWWPRDAQDRMRLPDWLDSDEEIELRGTVLSHVSRTYAIGQEDAPPRGAARLLRQNVDEAFWRGWLGQSPLPAAVLQGHPEVMTSSSSTNISAPHLLRDWPRIDAGIDKHHGYAAQWFALSILSVGLTLWFAVIRPVRAERPHFQ